MDVPAGTNSSPGAGSLPCTHRVFSVPSRDAEHWWAWASQCVCVTSWLALGLAGNVLVCLLSVGCSWRFRESPKDAPECRHGWASHCVQVAFPVTPPVSLLNEGGNSSLTGKIKDYGGKFKTSSSQGFNLNEHQHSLLCWKTYKDTKPVKCISSLCKLWELGRTCF